MTTFKRVAAVLVFALTAAEAGASGPSVQWVYPANGATVEGTYPVAVNVVASAGALSNVTYQVAAGSPAPLTQAGNSSFWTDNWDSTTATSGTVTLTASATDSNGTVTASVSITVNNGGSNTAPKITPTYPVPNPTWAVVTGAIAMTGAVQVQTGATLGSSGLQVSVDGGAYGAATGAAVVSGSSPNYTYSVPWNTAGSLDGNHLYLVRATDSNGAIGYSQAVLVTTDQTAPSTLLTSPPAGTRYPAGVNVTVTAAMADWTSGLSQVGFYWDSLSNPIAVWSPTPVGVTNGNYQAVRTVTLADEGCRTLIARATDNAGLISQASVPVVVDWTAPSVASSFLPEGRLLGGNATEVWRATTILSVAVADPPLSNCAGTGVANVRVRVTNTAGNELFAVDRQPVSGTVTEYVPLIEGDNLFSVVATDLAGNASPSQAFTLRYVPPKATGIFGPQGGTLTAPDGTSLAIPAGALRDRTEIAIVPVEPLSAPAPAPGGGLWLSSLDRQILPAGLVFAKPATLTLAYVSLDVDADRDGASDRPAADFAAYLHDGREWLRAGGSSDSAAKKVTASVQRLALFSIGTETDPASGATFYATRNPLRVGEGTEFVVNLASAGSVTLEIRDLAGDRVKTVAAGLSLPAGRSALAWDGRGPSGRPVAPGLYYVRLVTPTGTTRKTIGVAP